MMQISTRIKYATRALIHLALGFEGEPIPLREISKRENISEKYLGDILVYLKSAGIIRSIKGKYGGYHLSLSPEKISLFDIVSAFESGLLLDKETKNDKTNSDYFIWIEIEENLIKNLKSSKLNIIVNKYLNAKEVKQYQI